VTSCRFEHQIGDYVDDLLSREDARAFEAHLADCGSCRPVVDDLRSIRRTSAVLERHAPPPHAWPKIAAAVQAEAKQSRATRLFGGVPWWQALAAAAMLVIVCGGAWQLWMNRSTTAPAAAPAAVTTRADATPAATRAVDTPLTAEEEHYTSAISGLETIAQANQTVLDTGTAEVLRANLDVIDNAIGQSRAALREEPSNPVAQESLYGALRSKLTLLQDTIALINEMRKGNEEGTARIVSEMKP
jgi:hypothetical protein